MSGKIVSATLKERGYVGPAVASHQGGLIFKMSPGLFRFLTKGSAGEAGKCLNSCSYCCQASRCPSAATKHTYSMATVHLMG